MFVELSIVEFGLLEAVLIGFVYFLGTSEVIPVAFCFSQPVFLGFIFGAAYGDIRTGVIMGATMGIFYLGNIALAGMIAQDQALACCIALPVALQSGMPAETAIILAIPFGLFGGTMDNFRRLLNGVFNGWAHKAVDELNFKKLYFNAFAGPLLLALVLRATPVFLLLYVGGEGITTLMSKLPEWLMNGFGVVGGMLPAVGLVMCATLLGAKKLLPFFFASFILMSLTHVGTFSFAILAALVAAIFVMVSPDAANLDTAGGLFGANEEKADEPTASLLTGADHWWIAFRINFFHRVASSLQFLYGTSYGGAIAPYLRKIYAGNDEKLKDAMHRALQPYMTEMAWGNILSGAAIAMEEQIASGNEEVVGEQIHTLKTSLMGPMASFGDTINWLTLYPITNSIALSLAVTGTVWAAWWPVPFILIYLTGLFYITYIIGYRAGKRSIPVLMRSGMLKKLMLGASAVGMSMMGAMSASFANIKTPVEAIVNEGLDTETLWSLQATLDSLLPNMLALIYVGSAYFYLTKGGKFIYLILASVIIGIGGAALGLLG
jgi:mannose/fructose/N-acetylgalactosamine-specific phosphotransferase system component IID/mannose/fructose/N-acetylgalactosamine-specific phosphotransferase system component IIC